MSDPIRYDQWLSEMLKVEEGEGEDEYTTRDFERAWGVTTYTARIRMRALIEVGLLAHVKGRKREITTMDGKRQMHPLYRLVKK